jgi:hypothetical protein
MTTETRTTIAEQARVYAFFGFAGVIGCWLGFAHQLHLELQSDFRDDGFGLPLAVWLLGAMLSTVLLTTSLAVTFLHRYLEAPATERRLAAAKVLPPE